MKKLITAALIWIAASLNVKAQESASAAQLITVELAPTIQITANNSANVNLGFNNTNNYINGVQSTRQDFTVQSNRDFVVNVRTNAPVFTYSGGTHPAPEMPVENILFLTVNNNNTGGVVASSFNTFASLSSNPRDLLLNCKNGGDRNFSVSYKAIPGTEFPAGYYTVDVIYTATQP